MVPNADAVLKTDLYERLVEIRRDLHQHPELSWQERRTADQVCKFLDQLGVRYRRDVARTGVIAEIPAAQGQLHVALRADMDALPILEETELPYASSVSGVMHACGHDGHTTMLLGAAALLQQTSDLPAPVRLVFQPAEERAEGAQAMIQQGVLDNVGMIFGVHVDRHFPLGSVVVTEGTVNASTDQFAIRITGRGGHAARPHETVDAVVVGSLMITALQTIVSREVNPSFPSVVTVGRFDAGTAANVIAGQACLEGTVRAQHKEVRESLLNSIQRIAQSIGQLHGASVAVSFDTGTPPVINAPHATKFARAAATHAVGESNVLKMDLASMGGEDFSYYQEHVPSCFVRIGTAREGVDFFPTHSSRFDFDEQALAVGASYFASVAIAAGRMLSTQPGT